MDTVQDRRVGRVVPGSESVLSSKTKMPLTVRSADLSRDRSSLLGALESYLGVPNCPDRFDWLYIQGAFGQARALLLTDEAQNNVVGVAALFPRSFKASGKTLHGCVLGDFCLSPSWRSLGPGLQLQRACLGELSNGSLEVAYDFPSAGMQAIYGRLGFIPQAEMVRLARPLRVDQKIQEHVRFAPLGTALAGIGNKLLHAKDALSRKKAEDSASVYEGEIGEEFTELANRMGARPQLSVYRTAAYLKWRFREHPYRKYGFITLRRAEMLTAYLVYSADENQLCIADIYGEYHPASMAALINAAVEVGRALKSETLSVSLLKGHPWVELLKGIGFYEREARPVLICKAHPATSREQWFLTDGDRES